MTRIWEPEHRLKIWLKIELLAVEAWGKVGLVPASDLAQIKKKAAFQINRIEEIEAKTRHDVISFVTNVAENVGPAGRWLHYGLTSSDILDTCLSLQLREAADLLIGDLQSLLKVIKKRAIEHKMTPIVGRSHGVHAEPTTFGLKLVGWYEEIRRHLIRIQLAREEVSVGKVSGAVGNYGNGDPRVEAYVCEKLGLRPDPVSTQVISRDRYAVFFAQAALLASSVERIATEIRHLQRTEVLEAEEFFHEGQKGSSAMPHKRNPVLSENLTGLARLVRSYAIPAMEDMVLWHERDISHSSVERVIGPDATIALDFMLSRLTGLIEKWIIYPRNMMANLKELGDLVYSESVLLALIRQGLTREEAYRLVQGAAMRVWTRGRSFREELKADRAIRRRLGEKEIEQCLDLKHHLRHVNAIFKRVFG